MATRKVGGIAIDLIARTEKWTKGFGKARKDVNKFETSLMSAAKRLAAFAAGAFAIQRMSAAFTKAARSIDEVAKSSDKLGIATEKLIGLRHAAELTGVQTRKLEMGLQRMTRRVAEAAGGTGEARMALKELGVDARELARLSPDEMFLKIADAMGEVDGQSKKVRLAFKLFDSEGVALVNTLNKGREGIQQMMDDAERLGFTFTRAQAAQVEMANDAMARLRRVSEGVIQKLLIELAPAITVITDKIIEWSTKGEPIGQKLIKMTAQIARVMAIAANAVDVLNMAFHKLLEFALKSGSVIVKTYEDVGDTLQKVAQKIPGVQKTGKAFVGGLSRGARIAKQESEKLSETLMALGEESAKAADKMWESLAGNERIAQINEAMASVREEAAKTAQAVVDANSEAGKKTAQQLYQEQQVRQEHTNFIIKGLKDIVSNSNLSAREEFRINKALAIAETSMNTATAIMKYHSQGNIGMAIAAGVIGAAQVAAISATQFEGGAPAAAPSVGAEATSMAQPEPSRVVNINLGDGSPSREYIESLMGGISEAVGDGVQFNIGTT